MAIVPSLRERLSGIVGGNAMAPEAGNAGYSVDGQVPRVVVFPSSQEEVAAMLALASREGLTVIPRGSGALMALGGLPERVDLVLGLGRLQHTIEHAPGDLTVTVGAGTALAELQQTLARAGQWLPLDPPLARQQTVGGVLATNLPGPLSLGYGTARDMVIGMRVAGPDGTSTKSGGKVVKNVTGFDVAKAHLGALGTLGVILEASFKVAPLPQKNETVVASFSTLEKALEASQEMMRGLWGPQALELAAAVQGGPGIWRMYVRYMGSGSGVERRLRETLALLQEGGAAEVELVGEEATQAWRRLSDFGWDSPRERSLLVRLGCLPSRVRQLAGEVMSFSTHLGCKADLLVSPGRGVVRCRLSGEEVLAAIAARAAVDGLRELAASTGGYAVVELCPSPLKMHLDAWGDVGDGLPLMRRLKEQMDPGRVLNPGRFVGGI